MYETFLITVCVFTLLGDVSAEKKRKSAQVN